MAAKMGNRKQPVEALDMCKEAGSYIFNRREKTLRGSAVNLAITITILILVVVGCFNDEVATRLDKMSTLIIGFFTASFGVWSYKKYQEGNNGL
ncbi:MAG: hypothetical protein WC283_02630 [Candidatus Paceibacterota bacterium]|jgi:hypothetical protein